MTSPCQGSGRSCAGAACGGRAGPSSTGAAPPSWRSRSSSRGCGPRSPSGRRRPAPAPPGGWGVFVCLFGCLKSQQQASVSQGRICSDNFTCCHTETEVADQTFYLTQSQYTDTGPTSPSADPNNARRLAG